MLVIILNILKILGIILLAFIAIIISLLLIVLFVPIRYKAQGEYKEKKADILLNASFLFHIISVSFSYKENKSLFSIKLLGFNLKKKRKQTSQNTSKTQNESETPSDTSVNNDASNNENNEIHKKSLKETLCFYLNLLKSDAFKSTLVICKTRIGKILKSILPKKGKINIWLGFENAGTTGEIVGYYKALYAYIGHVVKLYSYYDRQCTEADFKIKGRICTVYVLYNMICILLNKNVRRLLKVLKNRNK